MTQELLCQVLQSFERQRNEELQLRDRQISNETIRLQIERETLELAKVREEREAASNALRDSQMKLQLSVLTKLFEKLQDHRIEVSGDDAFNCNKDRSIDLASEYESSEA